MRVPSGSRRIYAATGVLAAAALTIFAIVHSPPVRVRVLRLLASRLAAAGVVARADSIDYNLFTLTVRITSVSLATPEHSTTPFLTAKSATLSLPWRALTGRFQIDSVEIVGPRVILRRDALGRDNWTIARTGAQGGGIGAMHIGRLAIADAAIDWTDEAQAAHLDAAFSLEMHDAAGGTAGSIQLTRPAVVRWRGRSTSLDGVGGRLAWNDRDLALDGLSLRAPEGTLRLDGRVDELLGAARFDARLETDLNLDAVSPWLNLERAVQGTAQAALHVTDSAAEFTTLRGRLAGGDINGGGALAFGGGGSVRVAWENIDVAALARDISADPPRTLPASRASGSIEARWADRDLSGLRLTATARLAADPKSNRRSDPPVDGALAFEIQDRRWRLSTDGVDALGARTRAALQGTLDVRDPWRSTIGGRVRVDTVADGREWPDALVRAGFIGSAPPIRGSGSGDFRIGGTLASPALDGDVTAAVTYQSAPPADLHARVSATPDAIGLSGIDARAGGFVAVGDVRWAIASDRVAGSLKGSVPLHELAALSPALPRSLASSGAVSLSCVLSGRLAAPLVAIHAAGAGLTIAGQPVDSLDADFRASQTDISIGRLVAAQGTGRLEAAGTLNVAREAYTVRTVISDWPVHPVPGANGEPGDPVGGRVTATFDGAGTLSGLGGRGRVSILGAAWRDADFGTIAADVTLSGRTATATFEARDVGVHGSAAIGVDANGPLSVSAAWNADDVAEIARRLAVDVPVSGSAAIAAEWSAARNRLSDGRGWLRLDRADVAVKGQRVHLTRSGRLDVDRGAIRVAPIVATSGASTLTLEGEIRDAQAGGRLALTLDGSLADFGFLRDVLQPRAEGSPDPLPLAGSITVRVLTEGSRTDPRISAVLQIAEGRVPVAGEHAIEKIEVSARYDAGVLTLTRANAAFEGASVAATAHVPSTVFVHRLPSWLRPYVAAASGPATLNATVRSITPSVAAPFVEEATLAEVGLHADAAIALETDALTIDRLRGAVTLGRADVSLGGVPFDQAAPTRFAVRNGRLTIEAFRWGGGDQEVILEGGVSLSSEPAIDVTARAAIDLRTLAAFVPGIRATGRGDAGMHVTGALADPNVNGYLTLSNGELRIEDPRAIVSDLQGTITFGGDAITFERVSAAVNGGYAELAGTIHHRQFTPAAGSITLTAAAAAIDIDGARAETDARLTWTNGDDGPFLTGTVTLRRGAYRERVSLTGRLFAALRGSTAAPTDPGGSLLDRTRLDVRVMTEEDFVVDNNVARLTLGGDLRAVGTVARPSVVGRAALGEGGTVFFNGTRYRLEEGGSIDFANPTRIEPDLDLKAVARVQGDEITVTLTGTPATLQATLDSDNPQHSDSDKISLLLLGRTATDGDGGLSAGGEQVIGLLTGGFLEAAGRAIGFDTARIERGTPDVRFDAGLVAAETDPGARFTFGKTIGSRWDVVFSQSLQQSGGLTWIVGYKPRARIDLRVVSLDDGDRLYTFSHDVTFGAPSRKRSAAARAAARVAAITITGAGADEPALRARLKIRTGDRFSFFLWQDDRDRLERFYREHGRLEARVAARRVPDVSAPARLQLLYDVRTGPATIVAVEGFSPSANALDAIERAWQRAVADEFLVEEAVAVLRRDLAAADFLLPSIAARVENAAGGKTLRAIVTPGIRAADRRVELAGNVNESRERLLAVLSTHAPAVNVWTDPDAARDALAAFYRANGYLDAVVRVDPIAMEGAAAVRTIRIDEGAPFRVATVRIVGVRAIAEDEARLAGLAPGDRYTESRVEEAQMALDARYRSRGYNRVSVDYQVRATPRRGTERAVDIVVRVNEGPQQRLREVTVAGVSRAKPVLVSRALQLEVGAPVDLTAWSAARRRVYATGVFRSVDIQRETIDAASPETEEPVRAAVTVQEWPPLRLRYGLELRDELQAAGDAARANAPGGDGSGDRSFGAGLAASLEARGLFGTALSAGVAGRYTRDTRASRAYATAPLFFGRPITTNVFIERSREALGAQPRTGLPVFEALTTEFTFEQRVRPRRQITLSYLYSLERNHTRELDPDPFDPLPFDVLVTTQDVASALVVDTRNDLNDASRGWFHSSTVEYAPEAFRSDLRFLRYFAQHYAYTPVGRVVLAGAARLGLATAFDTTLTPNKRFFAGGGNSVRGYPEDVLGPTDAGGSAVGGNALAAVNAEARFPLFRIVRGVAFFDAGRAFARVGDLSLRDLATSAGAGLRVQTPFVLLRVDAGVPFDARFGPRRVRWFFSIGQMF